MDEATPHIHATVVPIVKGERRKAKPRSDEPGKKQYREKNTNAPRLCADDMMARAKLTEYQGRYAESMKKYGLERGIRGSEARHITTQEFYRNIIPQKRTCRKTSSNYSNLKKLNAGRWMNLSVKIKKHVLLLNKPLFKSGKRKLS